MKNLLKRIGKIFLPTETLFKFRRVGNYYNEIYNSRFADEKNLGKASNFIERFREIVSDPLNLIIERVPNAGYVDENKRVTLHNGIKASFIGKDSYYERFSEILIINRGVHEPLEEYCFQQLVNHLGKEDKLHTMLELGAYWGHYSLWFSKYLTKTSCTLVEPDKINYESGKRNFLENGFKANFIQDFVSKNGFTVDNFLFDNNYNESELTLLHSDIQGYEEEMLLMSKKSLSEKKIKYLMISTHGKSVHDRCVAIIKGHNYKVSVESEPKHHTTSSDGFIFAYRQDCEKVINQSFIMGRHDIANETASKRLEYLNGFIP